MLKILIIDDDEVVRENTADFLNREGFITYTANDGVLGVQMACKFIPDLILCDVILPKLKGGDVLKKLQSFPQTSIIPIIFITASRRNNNIDFNQIPESYQCINKPYYFEELLSAIHKIIDQ
jgi:CheY-like chemotaxis protein